MTPRHPRDLSDTERELMALGEEAARLASHRRVTPVTSIPVASESSETMRTIAREEIKAAENGHILNCLSGEGPVGKLESRVESLETVVQQSIGESRANRRWQGWVVLFLLAFIGGGFTIMSVVLSSKLTEIRELAKEVRTHAQNAQEATHLATVGNE